MNETNELEKELLGSYVSEYQDCKEEFSQPSNSYKSIKPLSFRNSFDKKRKNTIDNPTELNNTCNNNNTFSIFLNVSNHEYFSISSFRASNKHIEEKNDSMRFSIFPPRKSSKPSPSLPPSLFRSSLPPPPSPFPASLSILPPSPLSPPPYSNRLPSSSLLLPPASSSSPPSPPPFSSQPPSPFPPPSSFLPPSPASSPSPPKRRTSYHPPSNMWLEVPTFDLTNKLINLMGKSNFFSLVASFLVIADFLFRLIVIWSFVEMYKKQLKFSILGMWILFAPRMFYFLSMLKVLFNADVENTFLWRISRGYTIIDDFSLVQVREEMQYDYILNFQRKVSAYKKWKMKPFVQQLSKTIFSLLIRIFFSFLPFELCPLFLLFCSKARQSKMNILRLFLMSAWIYKSYEILAYLLLILLAFADKDKWAFDEWIPYEMIGLMGNEVFYVFGAIFLLIGNNSKGSYEYMVN